MCPSNNKKREETPADNAEKPGADEDRRDAEPEIRAALSSEEFRAGTIDYIGDLLFELRKLAKSADQPLVTYLIDMACQEAGTLQAKNYYSGLVRSEEIQRNAG